MVVLNKTVLSLTVGVWTQLKADKPVTWQSSNPNILVDKDGWCLALTDKIGATGRGTITATAGTETATCRITVVPWLANRQKLEFIKNCGRYIVTKDDNRFIAILTSFPSNFKSLYETTDFETFNLLMTLPDSAEQIPILKTPHGYFINCTNGIYRSSDLKSVTLSQPLEITSRLYHNFTHYHDAATNTTYIYAGQYSVGETPTNNDRRHKIYRGVITESSEMWDVVYDFPSQMERINDPATVPPFSVRHLHAVQADPYTGDVYAATGDYPWECFIFRSTDNGDTWLPMNREYETSNWAESQPWRALSIWFTEDYIYWNNDTATPPQGVWRLKRSSLASHSPQNDLKERVITVDDGAHWFTCDANDLNGERIRVMGASVEGSVRDLNSRTYSIKEKPNGVVEVNELYLADGGDSYNMMLQLEPKFQDKDGFIYLNRISAEPRGVWKMRIVPEGSKKRDWKQFVFKE